MKILRIETLNLNSLYGTTVVDLDDTLRGASLFLIHGPTGSGKSTLMDAVSLALFGQTPRLYGAAPDLKGDKPASDEDPRAIMSRGTGRCAAEVIFSKIAGVQRPVYRARWSCHRAHGRPDGRYGRPDRSLERQLPDGTFELLVSDHRAKYFGPHFAKVLEGFSVDDFKRSMLLAQGQFDAFLGATTHERAAILERLTDTSDYKEIGHRTALIRSRHKKRIADLNLLVGVAVGLDPEAVSTLRETHETQRIHLKERTQQLAGAEAALAWLDHHATLLDELEVASVQQDELRSEQVRAKSELDELAAHERCQTGGAFGQLDAHTRAAKAANDLNAQLDLLDSQLPSLSDSAEQREAALRRAESVRRHATEGLETLRPLVDAAEATARRAADSAKLATETAGELSDAEDLVSRSEARREVAAKSLADAQVLAKTARADLDSHPADTELAQRWGELRTRLDGLVATFDVLDRTTRALSERRTALDRDRAALAMDQANHSASSEATIEPMRGRLEEAEAALDARLLQPTFEATFKGHATDVEVANAALDALKGTGPVVAIARTQQDELRTLRGQVDATEESLAVASQALDKLTNDLHHRRDLEVQARAHLEGTRRIASLVGHRARLVAGEPCPLCGASEHPYRGDVAVAEADSVVSETLQAAEHALEEASTATTAAELVRRTTEQDLGRRAGLLEGLKHSAADLEARLLGSIRAAEAALEAVGLPTDATVDEVEEAIMEATRRLGKARAALSALEVAKRDRDKAADDLRTARERDREAQRVLREKATVLGERGQALDAELDGHRGSQTAAVAKRDEVRSRLLELGLELDNDEPARWRALGDAHQVRHRGRLEAVTAAEAQVATLDVELQGVQTLLGEQIAHRNKLSDKLRERQTSLDGAVALAETAVAALKPAWRECLDAGGPRPTEVLPPGSPTPHELLEAQRSWVNRATDSATQASEAHQSALHRLDEARTKRRTKADMLAGLVHDRDAARAKLDGTLRTLALDTDEALAALRLVEARVLEFGSLRDGLQRRATTLTERIRGCRQRIERHTAERPPAISDAARGDLVDAVSVAERHRDDAQRALEDTARELHIYDEAVRSRREHIEALRTAEREAKPWLTLHDLIGTNDGDQFRLFAQSLNLKQLLDRANVHLVRLTERYRLILRLSDGLPTLDFDLEDRWQTNQRVAPQSLSGGERFVVSLALALGLSDFRSLSMPIETLLLDEGFGTLDEETLSTALSALSQLQAGGRQVGIISHVTGLRERIEARIEVRPLGSGRSEVRTTGAAR